MIRIALSIDSALASDELLFADAKCADACCGSRLDPSRSSKAAGFGRACLAIDDESAIERSRPRKMLSAC